MTIAETAFNVIVARLRQRQKAHDFDRIASTGYSFEEWVTCEAFIACSEEWPDSRISPRPHYSKVGSELERFGDLLVPRKLSSLLIEIGILHATTGRKWDRKIERDALKLSSITDAQALQFVIVVDAESNRANVLADLKGRIPERLKRDPKYEDSVKLNGQSAHFFGWTEHT
jgi:hypothetical protein